MSAPRGIRFRMSNPFDEDPPAGGTNPFGGDADDAVPAAGSNPFGDADDWAVDDDAADGEGDALGAPPANPFGEEEEEEGGEGEGGGPRGAAVGDVPVAKAKTVTPRASRPSAAAELTADGVIADVVQADDGLDILDGPGPSGGALGGARESSDEDEDEQNLSDSDSDVMDAAEEEVVVFTPALESAIRSVVNSSDPMDQPDFSVVDFINRQFPSEQVRLRPSAPPVRPAASFRVAHLSSAHRAFLPCSRSRRLIPLCASSRCRCSSWTTRCCMRSARRARAARRAGRT